MKSSGVTLEEIRRLFKALEESKLNNSMQILIDNEMCKQFQDIIETICSSKDKKDKEIERLTNIINELDKLIEQYSKNEYYYKYNGKYLKSEIINDLKELKESK